jgi:hypothetical protein
MAEELRFAVRCPGSSRKHKTKKKVCLNCKSTTHNSDCPLKVIRSESVNGVVHMRDRKHSRDVIHTGDFELDYLHDKCDFGAGGYLHVEYSDTDS